jgi:hypothetical protein
MSDHCVQITFPFTNTDLSPIFTLEDRLIAALADAHHGECDGNEVGGGEATIFLYGPDADALLQAVLPVLCSSADIRDGWILKRYGSPEPNVRKEHIRVTDLCGR